MRRTMAGVLLLVAVAGSANAGGGHSVTVTVSNVHGGTGAVLAALCADPKVPYCGTYRTRAPADAATITLTFTNVADGRYALSAFHDQNGDGKPQVPPEGYGFGNDAPFPPEFDASAITVSGDIATTMKMTYVGGGTSEESSGTAPPPGVSRTDVRANGLYGELYLPQNASGKLPAIILLGGSEGGIDTISAMAPSFALRGFAALALAYWGEEGLPQTLERIPLEYFDTAIAWLQARPGIDPGAIGVLGWSRGSEAALLIGTRNHAVHAVAAIAPSGIVWRGLNFTRGLGGPAWLAEDKPLPFLTPDGSAYDPSAMKQMFIKALPTAGARPEAEIPVEKINGPVLLISGTDDALWPSVNFASRIADRLKAAGFKYSVENLVYAGAGHAVFVGAPDSAMARMFGKPNAMLGGTAQANAAAWKDDWPKAVEFFDSVLKGSKR